MYLDIVHFQPNCCHLGPLFRRSLGITLGHLGQLASPDTHNAVIHKYLSLEKVIKIRSFVGGDHLMFGQHVPSITIQTKLIVLSQRQQKNVVTIS